MAGNSEKSVKAQWDIITTKVFCEVCVEEVLAGNRPNNTFNKIEWRNVCAKFNNRTNKNYVYKQLRNKWDALQCDWTLWNQLLRQETRLGWNHENGTIDATPQRWAELKTENNEYAKFEHNGLENTTELETMFARIISTGETAWTPAASPIFPDQQAVGGKNVVDLKEGSGDSDELIMGTQAEGNSEKRKKTTAGCSSKTKGKKVKSEGAAYMQRQLDRLCNAVESYASASLTGSSNKNYEELDGGIGECMDLLSTLPEIEDGSELYMLDTRLFMKRGYRAMLKGIKSVNSKVAWLK